MSTEKLDEILNKTDVDGEIAEKKEETLNTVETVYTFSIVSENINKPYFQTTNSLMRENQGKTVKAEDE